MLEVTTGQRLRYVLAPSPAPRQGTFPVEVPSTHDLLEHLLLTALGFLNAPAQEPVVTLFLTANVLLSPGFPSELQRCLLAGGISPSALEVSLPEKDFLNLRRPLRSRLDEFGGWGVQLAVHDFGVRAAPLALFERFPLATVYLHDSFAQQLARPMRAPHYPLALIRALVEAAACLEFGVVASGVSSPAVMSLLASLGCVRQRGPLFEDATAYGENQLGASLCPSPSWTGVKD